MTQVVQITAISVHILAAIVWIGGMAFLGLVVVPVMRRSDLGRAATELFHRSAVRFRTIGWVCIVLLLATGIVNLGRWGIGSSELLSADFWDSSFGGILAAKLVAIFVIVVLSAAHDFFVGPRASAAIRKAPNSQEAQRLRSAASWIGRVNFLLAVAVVVLAVRLARGL